MKTVILQLLVVSAASIVTTTSDQHNISACPLWHYNPSRNSTECVCGSSWNQLILCQNGQLYLRENFLLGTMETGEGHSIVSLIGESWFVFLDINIVSKVHRGYYKLPNSTNETELDTELCRPNNRKGFLCKECLPNYGPNAYYATCSKCDLSVPLATILYLLSKIVPVAIWFGLIMTFRIDLAYGPLLGYMIFCQLHVFVVREDNRLYLEEPFKTLEYSSFVLSSLWCLDIFHIAHIIRPFCISSQLKMWDVILLNFISVLSPLLLAGITYFMIEIYMRYCTFRCWMPFRHCFSLVRNWSATDSIIHAYASLYILAFPLLNYSAYKFLKATNLYGQEGNVVKHNVLIMNPTSQVYTHKMIAYFIIVMTLLFFLGILPSLFLLFYPTKIFRAKLETCFSQRCLIGLNTFMETFQGPLKNGCNGTRDFRIIPGLIGCSVLIYTVFSCIHHVVSHDSSYFLLALSTALAAASVLTAYLRPCKSSLANLSITFHCMWMAGFAMIISLWNIAPSVQSSVLMVLVGVCPPLPHLLMAIWLLHMLDTKVLHLKDRVFSHFKLFVVGKRLFGAELLPDRLMNSHQYREML